MPKSDSPSVLQHFHKAIANSKQDTSTWAVPLWHKILYIGIVYRYRISLFQNIGFIGIGLKMHIGTLLVKI